MTGRLEQTIAHGNYPHPRDGERTNRITCADGFTVSVVAGPGCQSSPRPGFGSVPEDYPGPYAEVEVGYPSERPEPWDQWAAWCNDTDNPTYAIYNFVPVDAVRALVAAHGGEIDPGRGTTE